MAEDTKVESPKTSKKAMDYGETLVSCHMNVFKTYSCGWFLPNIHLVSDLALSLFEEINTFLFLTMHCTLFRFRHTKYM